MTVLHYPDNLYADHEERKARARQTPVGAYRAPTEMPESERKLRTALAYVNHARDLIRDALGDNEPKAQREAKIAYDVATEEGRVPKWDPAWAKAPNCDGLSARDVRAPHPMAAEALRQADEFGRDDNASGV